MKLVIVSGTGTFDSNLDQEHTGYLRLRTLDNRFKTFESDKMRKV
jgi:hypothetical protein